MEKKFQAEAPPKVRKMFDAVLELFASGRELSTLKVSDITQKAGIGKGTAYEYFSTKEEIIVGALSSEAERYMKILFELVNQGESFQEVIGCVMDIMEEISEKYNGFAVIERIMRDDSIIGQNMLNEMEKHRESCKKKQLLTNQLVELAIRDHAITETSVYKVQMTILSQFFSYAYYLTHKSLYPNVPRQEVREFIYESILKVLN